MVVVQGEPESLAAVRRPGPVSLDDVYAEAGPDGPHRVLMSGIQAIVRVILDQRRLDRQRGLDTGAFVSGYEGSPLGGLDLELGRARPLVWSTTASSSVPG